ncbi:retrovirus polyprotein [Hirsutella rhossiliensis]|uniref:RNA-directed DNA polymerase n=1 Tax=Hirsutella rhossiliensis TaxID=111463 RepID=A0A9P8SL06_9HYPO|nr:retrovirus polyprotein [Hirsutella rhossiliensis]KAH0965330.1 retrovirus polyprotein [Hirsutella rhossiliensis]
MAEDNNNMQSDVLSALVAEIRSLREESSRRNTQFEEQPTPSVTPAVPIEDTRVVATHNPHPTKRPKLRDIPKFGGDKAQWRSWKLETEGKLRVDKEALGDAEGHFMYIFMSLEGKAKDNVTTFVEMQTEKKTFNVAELLNRLELFSYVGLARRCDSLSSQMELLDVRVNGTDFVPSLVDYGCLCYGAVSKRTFHSLQLPHIRVQPRILENAAGDGKEVKIDKITYVSIDLDGHQQHRVFMYVIDDLNWDMILGKRWMEDQDVHIHAKEGYLEIGSSGVQVRDRRRYQPPQLDVSNVMAATFLAEARRDKRKGGIGVHSVTMADIDKALRPKPKTDVMEKLPPQYHKWSRAFSQQLADQLPPHRPGVDLKIEVLKDEHGREKPYPGDRFTACPARSYWCYERPSHNYSTRDLLDLQDHRDKVGKVLQRLMDAGLQLDINKSEFEVKAVKYLGFIIEAECGIRVDPEKVEAVKGWATPTNVKSVRSFIGFANFYRIFMPDFSVIAEPLTRLTKKDVPFRWDGLCDEAFEKLKDLLITAPILHTSIQKGRLSWKQTLQDSPEANYAIHDKELLAILRCLEQWEPELRAVEHFKILTDHKNLRYFYSERRLTERQVRWSEFLSRFQFELEWRPGRKGGLPDALSRRDQDMPANHSDERLKGRIMRLFQDDHLRRVPISTLSTNTEGAQEINFGKEIRIFEDEELQQLWHAARQEDKLYQELTKLVADGAKNNRGLLCFRERVWIPGSEPLRTRIIQETHDSHITGHPGRDLTYSTLSRRFFWPGAASDVRRFVRNCEVCGRNTIWRIQRKDS